MKIQSLGLLPLVFLSATAYCFDWDSQPLQELTTPGTKRQAAFIEVKRLIETAGYQQEEFRVNFTCNNDTCEINVYPNEMEMDETYNNWRGCPLKYCATVIYSLSQDVIISETHWQ